MHGSPICGSKSAVSVVRGARLGSLTGADLQNASVNPQNPYALQQAFRGQDLFQGLSGPHCKLGLTLTDVIDQRANEVAENVNKRTGWAGAYHLKRR